MIDLTSSFVKLCNYYNTYATKSYEFRKSQLEKLKHSILKYEKEINAALYTYTAPLYLIEGYN